MTVETYEVDRDTWTLIDHILVNDTELLDCLQKERCAYGPWTAQSLCFFVHEELYDDIPKEINLALVDWDVLKELLNDE